MGRQLDAYIEVESDPADVWVALADRVVASLTQGWGRCAEHEVAAILTRRLAASQRHYKKVKLKIFLNVSLGKNWCRK